MAGARMWRLVAALLLLFAAVDVLVPGLCVADSEQPRVVQSRSHDEACVGDAEQDSQHDDCFCCCPHIIPGLRQSLGYRQDTVDDLAGVLAAGAKLSPAPLYHPPRAL